MNAGELRVGPQKAGGVRRNPLALVGGLYQLPTVEPGQRRAERHEVGQRRDRFHLQLAGLGQQAQRVHDDR